MRRRPRDDSNDEWRKQETVPLGRDTPVVFVRMRLGVDVREDFARTLAPLALEEDETPRRELSMIRHPRRERQERLGFLRRWTGPGHFRRRHRAPCPQQRDGIIHRGFMLS